MYKSEEERIAYYKFWRDELLRAQILPNYPLDNARNPQKQKLYLKRCQMEMDFYSKQSPFFIYVRND